MARLPATAPQFGQRAAKPKEHFSPLRQFHRVKDTLLTRLRYVIRWVESLQSHIKMGFVVSACMLTFLPIPDFLRGYIEQKAFFAPVKSSDIGLLKDQHLRQKISEHFFNVMDQFASEPSSTRKGIIKLQPARDNVRLNGWYINPSRPGMPTVLFHHGRGSNISNLGLLMKTVSDQGYGIFVYDYPGFGKSEGQPSEPGVYNAGLAASRYLQNTLHIPVDRQIMMGYSLGSGVATDVTAKLKQMHQAPMMLVLINTFPSVRTTFVERQQHQYAWTRKLFNPDKIHLVFDTEGKLKTLGSIPLIILQGQLDKDTPIPMLQDMLRRLNRPIDTLEALKAVKHRLQEDDYKIVGAHFFRFMRQAFPDLPYRDQ